MAYETIIVEVEDHIAKVTLNRPDALNALNRELMAELVDAMGATQANDKVRCIVLTGSTKAFAAGADIAMMKDKSFVEVFSEDLFGPEIDALSRVRKPVIAAVSGYALGGGCELAMMCDFIIASDTAKFGQPEINLGVMAGIGGTLDPERASIGQVVMPDAVTSRGIELWIENGISTGLPAMAKVGGSSGSRIRSGSWTRLPTVCVKRGTSARR